MACWWTRVRLADRMLRAFWAGTYGALAKPAHTSCPQLAPMLPCDCILDQTEAVLFMDGTWSRGCMLNIHPMFTLVGPAARLDSAQGHSLTCIIAYVVLCWTY